MTKINDYRPKKEDRAKYHIAINNAIQDKDRLEYIHNWRIVMMSKREFEEFNRLAELQGYIVDKNKKIDFGHEKNVNKIKFLFDPENADAIDNDEKPDQLTDDLKEDYKALYGRYPDGRWTDEKIQEKIDEFKENK